MFSDQPADHRRKQLRWARLGRGSRRALVRRTGAGPGGPTGGGLGGGGRGRRPLATGPSAITGRRPPRRRDRSAARLFWSCALLRTSGLFRTSGLVLIGGFFLIGGLFRTGGPFLGGGPL